jgi:hypothetical protein
MRAIDATYLSYGFAQFALTMTLLDSRFLITPPYHVWLCNLGLHQLVNELV